MSRATSPLADRKHVLEFPSESSLEKSSILKRQLEEITAVAARSLEYDRSPTKKDKRQASIILHSCSNFLESTAVPLQAVLLDSKL